MMQSYGWNLQRLQHSRNNNCVQYIWLYGPYACMHATWAIVTAVVSRDTVWSLCVCLLGTQVTHTHTHLTALFPGLPRQSGTRKVKTNLDFTEARDSEWQWHQLGCMRVCTLLQTENRKPHHWSVLQAECPSCRPTNSVKALKAHQWTLQKRMNR